MNVLFVGFGNILKELFSEHPGREIDRAYYTPLFGRRDTNCGDKTGREFYSINCTHVKEQIVAGSDRKKRITDQDQRRYNSLYCG